MSDGIARTLITFKIESELALLFCSFYSENINFLDFNAFNKCVDRILKVYIKV
jgi:hypothetical protein